MLLYQPHSGTYPPFFFFFARSYAIFCYAWRIHLACGRSGSDGYISPGGSLVSGEWLASPVHSGLCACWCRLFRWREPVDFGVPTGVLQPSRPHPAGRSPGWRAPRVPARCYPAQQLPVFTSVLRAVSFFSPTSAPQQLSTPPSEIRQCRKTKMEKNALPDPEPGTALGVSGLWRSSSQLDQTEVALASVYGAEKGQKSGGT